MRRNRKVYAIDPRVVTKTCIKCHATKGTRSFGRHNTRSDGYASCCLSCEARRKRSYNRSPKGRYATLKFWAHKRGFVLEIPFEVFERLNRKPCHYCGGKLPTTGHGLDRKNNKEGYTLENVVPCCGRCNNKKRTQSYDKFMGSS